MKKWLFSQFESTFFKIIKLAGIDVNLFLEQLVASTQSYTKTFITYHHRPRNTAAIRASSLHNSHLPKLAIVVQGLLVTEDEFTLETVKLYKRNFPGAVIIVSTWDTHDPKLISLFNEIGVIVLLNKTPAYAGISNINLQIVTSKSGIFRAKEMGAEYVIKTRTDQRIYATDLHSYLYHLINLFPLQFSLYKQTKRIIGVSINTFKYRLYGISDMFIYGHIDDMVIYWNVELDDRRASDIDIQIANSSLRNFAEWRICEVYLVTEYLKKIGRPILWTLEDSMDVYSDHFCIIDKENLDLYWGKYGHSEYRWRSYENRINIFEEMNFKDWINLYHKDFTIDEEILEMPIEI